MNNNDLILLDTVLTKNHLALAPGKKPEEFFELFVAEQVLKDMDLSYEELNAGLVAGGGDGGIDGLYVFVNGELVQEDTDLSVFKKNVAIEIFVIQSKTSRTFDETPVDKIATATRDLFKLDADLDKLAPVYNEGVRTGIALFRKAYTELVDRFPKLYFRYVFATKGDLATVHPNVRRKTELLEKDVKGLFQQAEYGFDFLGAAQLYALASRQPVTTYQLTLAENPISAAGAVGYVCLVKLRDYFAFIRDEKGGLRKVLFEANVRDYQGSTQVNEGIHSSLEAKDKEDFWWLNNGVTIVATKATLAGKTLTLEDPQIVNGLQTSTEIYSYFSSVNAGNDERSVLVRVIQPKLDDAESRDRIIKATNSQTTIPEASLRATDAVHRNIETSLAPYGFFYDRRKNFYKNEGKPGEKIISIPFMAQAVMSILLRRPDDARARPSSLLKKDEDYKAIFAKDYPLGIYRVCAVVVKRTEDYLRITAGLDIKDRTNLRYYVAMHAVACAVGKDAPEPHEVAILDPKVLDDNRMKTSTEIVMERYKNRGGNDQVAKGPNLRDDVKADLAARFPK